MPSKPCQINYATWWCSTHSRTLTEIESGTCRSAKKERRPMKRSAWKRKPQKPMKRARLKRESPKQAKLNAAWRLLRDDHLAHFPYCQLSLGIKGCPKHRQHKAVDVHHSKGRGKFLLDRSTYRSACRTGHDWIHTHPNAARELGLFNPPR